MPSVNHSRARELYFERRSLFDNNPRPSVYINTVSPGLSRLLIDAFVAWGWKVTFAICSDEWGGSWKDKLPRNEHVRFQEHVDMGVAYDIENAIQDYGSAPLDCFVDLAGAEWRACHRECGSVERVMLNLKYMVTDTYHWIKAFTPNLRLSRGPKVVLLTSLAPQLIEGLRYADYKGDKRPPRGKNLVLALKAQAVAKDARRSMFVGLPDMIQLDTQLAKARTTYLQIHPGDECGHRRSEALERENASFIARTVTLNQRFSSGRYLTSGGANVNTSQAPAEYQDWSVPEGFGPNGELRG